MTRQAPFIRYRILTNWHHCSYLKCLPLLLYESHNTTSSISSDPFPVCLCKNNSPNCSKPNKTLSVYPGETFHISVVSCYWQGNETIPALVRSCTNSGWLLSSQYIQQTNRTCSTFSYSVFSQEDVSQIELYQHLLVFELNVNQTCPPGFDISQEKSSCVCDPVLQKYTNNCNITNGLGQMTSESDDTFDANQSCQLIVHPQCPFDYCVIGKKETF